MGHTLSSGVRTARKLYRCDLCGMPIPKGEAYVYWSVADGSQIFSGHAHAICDAAFQDMHKPWWDDELPGWDDFRSMCDEGFPEHVFPWSHTCLNTQKGGNHVA